MNETSISGQIEELTRILPRHVRLVAVSKFHPAEAIKAAYGAGQRIFGESRAQEMAAKHAVLPDDIKWHFIGHLQTNKVRYIAPFVALIHSVDSIELMQEIERQGRKHNRIIPCLLEIHIAQEESKYGLTPEACLQMFKQGVFAAYPHVEIAGVMGMATYTDDCSQIGLEFGRLAALFQQIKAEFGDSYPAFAELSMGMSSDFSLAIEKGSTLVRIGSRIFGERE